MNWNWNIPRWNFPTSLSEVYWNVPTILVAGSSLIIGSEVIYYIYQRFLSIPSSPSPNSNRSSRNLLMTPAEYQLEKRKPGRLWNTVIIFPDHSPKDPLSPTHQLIYYFENARTSIHLCVYLVSHPWLMDIIRKKYEEGLLVQVVTDFDTTTAHNNFGPKSWRRAGIEVRMKATGFLMHHKFAVIDEEAVVTGSLNWTKQGAAWNQENVIVSTNPSIVEKYLEEFYSLWVLFDSETDPRDPDTDTD